MSQISDGPLAATGIGDSIDVDVVEQGGVAVVSVQGTVDLATAPTLASAIDEALRDRPDGIVLDLSGVTFLASAGMTIIASLHGRVGNQKLSVVAVGPLTARPLELVGMSRIVRVRPTLAAALQDFAA